MKNGGGIDTILQFKITLNESSPRVWRRILVPADYTFFDLHCAIQDAMGWAGGHLHAFYVSQQKGREWITIEFPNPERDDSFGFEKARDERKERIADYFGTMVKQCKYSYDFGDSWDHTIVFERAISAGYGAKYPQCVAGAAACPPEDCGGVRHKQATNTPRGAPPARTTRSGGQLF